MASRDRMKRHPERSGAADLVRVEVLVPRDRSNDIVSAAAGMREDHRKRKDRLAEYLKLAAERYGLRIFDNIDVERLDDVPSRSRVVPNALIERGDARAFAMGRKMLSILDDIETHAV
ncbi:hypothetical protein ASD52_04225 [Ensifer sp. Root142]|uniref:hypothetical protein n=1 Tax=Ensifer sp. Root142 TaxID=1736461 RepID=UPI00070A651D|nr:hypothetical protein [Ensifer sp. Root142]KQY79030.1 hypothetical protein ASD52_04225 [Ensifer sp. Root142]MDP9632107.1 hypothetical protein [Ensifer adhaerens]